MYSQMKTRVDKAISALASGKGIILLDDNKRENEGDIIFPRSGGAPCLQWHPG